MAKPELRRYVTAYKFLTNLPEVEPQVSVEGLPGTEGAQLWLELFQCAVDVTRAKGSDVDVILHEVTGPGARYI